MSGSLSEKAGVHSSETAPKFPSAVPPRPKRASTEQSGHIHVFPARGSSRLHFNCTSVRPNQKVPSISTCLLARKEFITRRTAQRRSIRHEYFSIHNSEVLRYPRIFFFFTRKPSFRAFCSFCGICPRATRDNFPFKKEVKQLEN